jgi:hypothetical protein
MSLTEHDIDALKHEWESVVGEAESYFQFRIIETSKSSPLVSEVDHGDLRVALKEMLAALEFHRYHHWETHVLNDEDRVLGVESARQREDTCLFTGYNFAERKRIGGGPRLADCGLPHSGDYSHGDAIFPQRIPESFRRGLLGVAASGFEGRVRFGFPGRVAIPRRGDQ